MCVNYPVMNMLWRLMSDRMNYSFVLWRLMNNRMNYSFVLFLNLDRMAEPFMLMGVRLLPSDLVNFDIDRSLLVIGLLHPFV